MTDNDNSEQGIRKEARIAANWWADTLREEPTIDIGDTKAEAFMNWARDLEAPVGGKTADEFERQLAEGIEDMVTGTGWDPDNPRRGQIDRAIRTDYYPETGVLINASEDVGIDVTMSTFPPKTEMWINPDFIEIKAGYSADTETLWSGGGK